MQVLSNVAKHPSIPLLAVSVETAIGSAPSSTAEQELEKDEQDEEEQPKKSKKRCFACKRRMGLTGFKCRCGEIFCAQHRGFFVHILVDMRG